MPLLTNRYIFSLIAEEFTFLTGLSLSDPTYFSESLGIDIHALLLELDRCHVKVTTLSDDVITTQPLEVLKYHGYDTSSLVEALLQEYQTTTVYPTVPNLYCEGDTVLVVAGYNALRYTPVVKHHRAKGLAIVPVYNYITGRDVPYTYGVVHINSGTYLADSMSYKQALRFYSRLLKLRIDYTQKLELIYNNGFKYPIVKVKESVYNDE